MKDIELRWVMYEDSDARHLQYRVRRPDLQGAGGICSAVVWCEWRDVPTTIMEGPDNG